MLRIGNRGEYTSNEFMEYCLAKGIKKEHTVPHTPQQNGVVKHKNRTMVLGDICITTINRHQKQTIGIRCIF